MRGKGLLAFFCLGASLSYAQPVLTETVDYPAVRPGPAATQSGYGCFHLASGTITPGDVDWVQIKMPRGTTQTVVDVDFPANAGGSALLASVVSGSTAFNISDNNNTRDALCGLHATSVPMGSTRDSAANLNATARNITINVGITGAADTSFVGAHSENFSYDVWIYAATVPCTSDVDCNDGVACTVDTCDLGTGNCFSDADDAACDDGAFCNGVEFCDAMRGCRPGQTPDCDDGVGCTYDDCDPLTDTCVNLPDDGFCDDEEFCNGEEWCDVQFDCQPGAPPSCDDGVGCTVDVCDPATDACAHAADDSLCDDGRFCNGVETCDALADCQAGVAPDCDDGVGCTVDSCDPALDDCLSVPDDGQCDNGVFCDGAEVCDPENGCAAGGDPCPGQFCRESEPFCVDCLADADCDDGDFCNGAEVCDPTGMCVEGAPPCPPDMVCNPDQRRCESGLFTLDFKPGVCPNRVKPGAGNGYVAMALTGAPGADVRNVDRASLRLSRTDGVGESLSPNAGSPGPGIHVEDVATPFDGDACGCHTAAGDGYADLVVYFSMPTLVTGLALDKVPAETQVELQLSGRLLDGSAFQAADCVTVERPGKNPKEK